MVSLGELPGGSGTSVAYGVSADGSIVVSRVTADAGFVAFVWDARHGMRRLADVLESAKVDLTGWKPFMATAVSSDGSVIVGAAKNPAGEEEAFIVRGFKP